MGCLHPFRFGGGLLPHIIVQLYTVKALIKHANHSSSSKALLAPFQPDFFPFPLPRGPEVTVNKDPTGLAKRGRVAMLSETAARQYPEKP